MTIFLIQMTMFLKNNSLTKMLSLIKLTQTDISIPVICTIDSRSDPDVINQVSSCIHVDSITTKVIVSYL